MIKKPNPQFEFPEKLEFLFRPMRYKVAHGGRGSGKSWGYARALVLLGAKQKLRILCTREVQNSIKDSVHKLISDQIAALGVGPHYDILETTIRGRNGTEFIFAGLAKHTVDSIKSYEGIDIVWVEEAQLVSKRSWDVLIPTIRKEGSEIWISFNPELDIDETWQRFVASPPPDSCVVQMNWADNPWFPKVLETERQHCYLTNREDYDNIWEGRPRSSVAGAIYSNELAAATKDRQIRPVPYDPMHEVHVVFDLGWNDAMSLIFVQRVASELRVIDYEEASFKTLDEWAAIIREKRYNLGEIWLPHDGEHKDFKTGKSAKEIMEALGFTVSITPKTSIEDGIRTARMVFRRVYFDEHKASRLLVCLRRYRRTIHQSTGEPMGPAHDEFSHGADCFRYLCMVADLIRGKQSFSSFKRRGSGMAV